MQRSRSERILYRGVREANASFTAAFAKRTHPLPRRSRSERILFTAAFAKRTHPFYRGVREANAIFNGSVRAANATFLHLTARPSTALRHALACLRLRSG